MEYWLVDTATGNSQGCYESLDEALHAAEIEAKGQSSAALDTLSLLATPSDERLPTDERSPAPKRRAFVRLSLGFEGG